MTGWGGGSARPQAEFKLVDFGAEKNQWLQRVANFFFNRPNWLYVKYYDTADYNGSRPTVTEEYLCKSKVKIASSTVDASQGRE